MDASENDLNLLTIFHYVLAASYALFGCFPFIHLTVGIAMLRGGLDQPGKPGLPAFVPYAFIAIAAALILSFWAYAASLFYAGRCLRARKRLTFCTVMAAVSCVFVPFGTALGVFSLIVLQRPQVRAQFA